MDFFVTKETLIKKTIITIGGNCLLITLAVYCSFGALITAFDFPVEIRGLLGIWLLFSLAVSAIAVRYHGKGLLTLVPVAIVLLIWKYPEITEGARWTIYSITNYYSLWIPVTVLFPDSQALAEGPAVFFAAAGVAVIFLLAVSVCLRRSTFLTILSTLPIVALTFVITDSQADAIYLFGLIAVYLAMLFSSAISPDDFQKRGLILAPMLVLAMLFVGLTYLTVPPEKYERDEQMASINSRIRLIASQIGSYVQLVPGGFNLGAGWPEGLGDGVWMFNVRNVSIADAGARIIRDIDLLEVIATEPGTFYLRGYSMDHFDGRSWLANSATAQYQDEDIARGMPAQIAELYTMNRSTSDVSAVGMIINNIRDYSKLSYIPYYSSKALPIEMFEEINMRYPGVAFFHIQKSVHELNNEVDDNDIVSVGIFFSDSDLEEYKFLQILLMQEMTFEEYLGSELFMTYERYLESELFIVYSEYLLSSLYMPFEEFFESAWYMTIEEFLESFYQMTPEEYLASRIRQIREMTIDDYYELLMQEMRGMTHEELLEMPGVEVYPPSAVNKLDSYSNMILRSGKYTEIEKSTAQGLRQLALDAGIDPTADRVEIVDAVASYIRSSGSYTLTPAGIPGNEDFALYFLETLKEGYCIHFATAAVLMLRALDIPARFVSGYVVTVPQNRVNGPVVATDRNAHAWVEVYYEDVGWLYLEVTPTATGAITPVASPHNPATSTAAPPTPPPTPDIGDRSPNEIPPRDEDRPQAGAGSGGQNARNLPAWVYNVATIILCILIGASILPIRRSVMLKLRAKSFMQEDTNKAVVCMWRYIVQLSRREAVPPTAIEDIALKARFSQHRITNDEHLTMMQYTNRLADEIYRGKADFGRTWLKYVRALY